MAVVHSTVADVIHLVHPLKGRRGKEAKKEKEERLKKKGAERVPHHLHKRWLLPWAECGTGKRGENTYKNTQTQSALNHFSLSPLLPTHFQSAWEGTRWCPLYTVVIIEIGWWNPGENPDHHCVTVKKGLFFSFSPIFFCAFSFDREFCCVMAVVFHGAKRAPETPRTPYELSFIFHPSPNPSEVRDPHRFRARTQHQQHSSPTSPGLFCWRDNRYGPAMSSVGENRIGFRIPQWTTYTAIECHVVTQRSQMTIGRREESVFGQQSVLREWKSKRVVHASVKERKRLGFESLN